MIYTMIVDAGGNGIGSHSYAEAPKSLPAGEIACDATHAANPTAWMVSNGALVASPKALHGPARAALREAEHVAVRFLMAGQFPNTEWLAYIASLRAILANAVGAPTTLPAAPAIPAGI